MFLPSKHEDLNKSTVVLGANIINLLKKRGYNIEELFQEISYNHKYDISLNHYFNIITFLWLIEMVDFQEFTIKLKET